MEFPKKEQEKKRTLGKTEEDEEQEYNLIMKRREYKGK